MIVFAGYALIAIIVAALLFYVVIALLPAGLTTAPQRDEAPPPLPSDRLVTREDLVTVQLPVVLRGYRMADTDDLLDRLTLEIAARDRELAALRAQGPVGAANPPSTAVHDTADPDVAVADVSVEHSFDG